MAADDDLALRSNRYRRAGLVDDAHLGSQTALPTLPGDAVEVEEAERRHRLISEAVTSRESQMLNRSCMTSTGIAAPPDTPSRRTEAIDLRS